MGIQIQVAVNAITDLQAVDHNVRTLCNTTPGAQCQAILKTEYQNWRRQVALLLQQRVQDPQLPLDAYLEGFRLRFLQSVCYISQTTPTTELPVADLQRKRKCATLCEEANI